jgi:hypothetical protein
VEKIGIEDFGRMFGCKPREVSKRFCDYLGTIDSSFHYATPSEFEEYVLMVMKLIHSARIERSSEENYSAWENGWSQHIAEISSGNISLDTLRPRYFRPSKFLRYNRRLIVSDNSDIEYQLFTAARYLLFDRYLANWENIYEIGCGSCQNLFLLSEMFPQSNLCGFDWTKASTELAKHLYEHLGRPISAKRFDMLAPSPEIKLEPNSAIVTIHALEQIGTKHEQLISFLLKAKPAIVVHCEPIIEFYDETNLLDYLAFVYSKKRTYLDGFQTALQKLHDDGVIEILESRRPELGGVIHEASLIVWKPIT